MNIYTHVLQQKLKSVMIELINFFFGDGDKEVIGIAKYGAIWTNKQQKHRLFLSKHRQPNVFHVKLSFALLLKEVASSIKKLYLRKAGIFLNIFRFIDELCTFINNEFEDNFNDIYLHMTSFEFKKENDDPCKASLLDLFNRCT